MTDPELFGRNLGEFLVRERIGVGGHGVVYRCEQRELGRDAVVKVLRSRPGNCAGPERFVREARLASQLEHPFSAHVYAFGVEDDGVLWIAMELVRGVTLGAYLKAASSARCAWAPCRSIFGAPVSVAPAAPSSSWTTSRFARSSG